MTIIDRKQLKEDEIFKKLRNQLLTDHQVPDYVVTELQENIDTENYCVETKHFVTYEKETPDNTKELLHLAYSVDTWINQENKQQACVMMHTLVIYDDFMEFEKIRVKELHGTKTHMKHIPNLN